MPELLTVKEVCAAAEIEPRPRVRAHPLRSNPRANPHRAAMPAVAS